MLYFGVSEPRLDDVLFKTTLFKYYVRYIIDMPEKGYGLTY